jgi:hypothetical protein
MRRAVLAVLSIAVALGAGCAQATLREGDGGVDGPGAIDAIDAPAIDAIDASTCVRSPCDIYEQCGCEAMPGQVCDLDPAMFPTGGTKCRDDLLHGDETLACTRDTSCAGGHGCIGGRCRRYCRMDDDCPGAGGLCIIHPTAAGQPIPGVTNCTTDCMPTAATNPSCPATWACHVYFDDPRYLTDCTPPGTGAVGMGCTSHNACAAGLDCVTLNPGGQQCRPSCLCPGGNCAAGSCPAGAGSCRGFTTPVVIGANTYGTCF